VIHFDFTLSDEDAQTLTDLVVDSANEAQAMTLDDRVDKHHREWFGRRAVYLRELLPKLKNTRVP
jgi:hypothetical protein